jgi:penicillin-binding protein 2
VRVLALGVLVAMAVLVVGLWHTQIVSYKRYQSSLTTQTFRSVRVPGVRGKIFDRAERVLAENRPSYNLNLYLDELRPQFAAEYRRQRAALIEQLRRDAGPTNPPASFLDRVLARFKPSQGLVRFTPQQRQQLAANVRYTVASNAVQRVGELLGQPITLDPRAFHRHHNQWPYRPLTILENLTPAQVARFLERGPGAPGVDLDVLPVRYYPHGEIAAHVLGYLVRDDQARGDEEASFSYSLPSYNGAIGLEYAFDDDLVGAAGTKSIVVNSLSYRETESVWQTPEPGRNLVLTLDLDLQRAAYHALRTVAADVRGAVVVMDVHNGDVVALVSAPAFNPNEFVTGIPEARWEQLNHPLYRVMLNRATQGAYHPGSVFKIITALACFDSGFDPNALFRVAPDPARPGRGAFFLGRRKIEDTVPPGDYDFIRAFKRSSNSYFIHYGLRAGRERVLNIGKRFFLGERIGLGTRQEVRGYFPTPDEVLGVWSDGNLANVCIGQEITTTPLQMAVVTAAIANGGKVLRPRLVLRVEPAEPTVNEPARREFPATVRGDIGFPDSTLALIREAMVADTELPEGTGFRAFQQVNANGRIVPRLPGFRVGGKTGTAEIKEGGRVVDKVTWFVAFGPYETPRYAVVVMVESGGSGGGTCAPVAREVFQAIAARMPGLKPAEANLARAN